MKTRCAILIGRNGMDGVYLEAWLLGNTNGYRKSGDTAYCSLTDEQIDFLRDEGWSVRPL